MAVTVTKTPPRTRNKMGEKSMVGGRSSRIDGLVKSIDLVRRGGGTVESSQARNGVVAMGACLVFGARGMAEHVSI